MVITLLRTGGIIPITKKAEKEVDWSEDEMKELLESMKNEKEDPGESRDATAYQIMVNDKTVPIDWDKIPSQYKKAFEDLKDSLKIVKK